MYRQTSRQNNNNLFAALTEHNDLSEDETNSGKGGIIGNNNNNNTNNSNSPVVHPIFEQFSNTAQTKPDKENNIENRSNNNMEQQLQQQQAQHDNDRMIEQNQQQHQKQNNNRRNQQMSQMPPVIQMKPPPVPEHENQLESPYTFWFTQRGRGAKNKPNTAGDFEQNIRCITTVSSVEQFWRAHTHLVQPSELNGRCDVHVFRYGIRPMWEDEANKEGGKWIVRLRKGFATRCWENLVLAMLGEQFLVGGEICGAVVSVRYHTEDIVSIWNKNANNQGVINQIRDIMKRVLNLPNNTIMEYKAHKESIKDASNRAHVQREQAEQSLNIRQAGAPAQGAGAGQHRASTGDPIRDAQQQQNHSPQSDRFNNSQNGQFYDQ